MGHYGIDCYHAWIFQGKNPITKLPAMAIASNLNHTQNFETWLTCSGASDHIIVNTHNLSFQTPYKGQDEVLVGNC